MVTTIGDLVPNISTSQLANWGVMFGVAMLVAIGGGILFYWIMTQRKFNNGVVVWKKVGGEVKQVFKGIAATERLGDAGDYCFIIKGLNKVLPKPHIQVGAGRGLFGARPIYWFFERADGEWINIGMEDIDERQKSAKAYYVDEDMRLQRLGIQKNLRDRFQQLGFWQKYGTMIVMLVFVLVITVCLVIMFKEMNGNWAAAQDAAAAFEKMANSISRLATCSGGGIG